MECSNHIHSVKWKIYAYRKRMETIRFCSKFVIMVTKTLFSGTYILEFLVKWWQRTLFTLCSFSLFPLVKSTHSNSNSDNNDDDGDNGNGNIFEAQWDTSIRMSDHHNTCIGCHFNSLRIIIHYLLCIQINLSNFNAFNRNLEQNAISHVMAFCGIKLLATFYFFNPPIIAIASFQYSRWNSKVNF